MTQSGLNAMTTAQIIEILGGIEAARDELRHRTLSCTKTGGYHAWSYASSRQMYTCVACGERISKPDLKHRTD